MERCIFIFVVGLVRSAGMHSNSTVRIIVSVAKLEGMPGVLKISCCDDEMRASYFQSPLDDFVSIFMMVFIIAELLVSEVGCDVKECKFFIELFGKLLHNDYV